MALRDVAALAETASDRLRLGLDPGDGIALERYAAWRRFDGAALVAVTDGINRLFANDAFPLRLRARGGARRGRADRATEALLHAARDGSGRRSAARDAGAAPVAAKGLVRRGIQKRLSPGPGHAHKLGRLPPIGRR